MTARSKGPGTQRAWADYARFAGAMIGVHTQDTGDATPVLVVPEAAVAKCKHGETTFVGNSNMVRVDICRLCGAFKKSDENDGRWQRPRILRVARRSK